MSGWADFAGGALWPLAFVIVYPLVTVAALEAASVASRRSVLLAGLLRQFAVILLPAGAMWLILRGLAGLPHEAVAVRVAETAFALTALYLTLRVAQALLVAVIDEELRAPQLLIDIVRIAIALLWGAVIVSNIWHIDLGSLIAAMGVGSIVLGFALQEFLGNLLSGLGLLSAHQFGLGDWIVVDGRAAQVVQMDWRTISLVDANGARLVVANSTLAKGNLVVVARAGEIAWATIPLTFPTAEPPETVRAAMLEAAASVPDMVPGRSPWCRVVGFTDDGIGYMVGLPVTNPSILAGPRDEFLSRLWYVAQRRRLRLPGGAEISFPEADCRRLLENAGAFRGEPIVLDRIAATAALRLYRRGDTLIESGQFADAIFVLSGTIAVSVTRAGRKLPLETLSAGRLFVLAESFDGAPSPVSAVAESEVEALNIPMAALSDASARSPKLAHDINSLVEARRQAIAALTVGLRRAA